MTGPNQPDNTSGDPTSPQGSPLADVWPAPMRYAMVVMLLVASVTVAWNGLGMTRWRTRPIPIQRQAALQPIELNKADETDLRLIPGIGPAYSRAILEHRQKNGPFQSVDDLLLVKGIGPSTLAKVRPYLAVSDYSPKNLPTVRSKTPEPIRATYATKKVPPPDGIDINRASADDWQRLPNVGPVLSARILEYRREKGNFQSIEELRKVKGIGPKIFDKLRPHLKLSP